MKIIGVNGIFTRGGRNTDLVLQDLHRHPDLPGVRTYDCDYPSANLITSGIRAIQRRNARILLDAHEPGDAVVAHSYGCLVVLRAMELGARFGTVFFFGAAMNLDYTFPYLGMRRLYNTFNPFDHVLLLGRFLPHHDFGDMGRVGYQGAPDPRVVNVQAEIRRGGISNHSKNYFSDEYRSRVVDFIAVTLKQESHDGA